MITEQTVLSRGYVRVSVPGGRTPYDCFFRKQFEGYVVEACFYFDDGPHVEAIWADSLGDGKGKLTVAFGSCESIEEAELFFEHMAEAIAEELPVDEDPNYVIAADAAVS